MPYDFHTDERRTARKFHHCLCCHRWIEPRSRYVKAAGTYYGDFYSYRAHEDCYAANIHIRGLYGCGPDDFTADTVEELANEDQREVRGTLDATRGHYPHAICRIEFTLRHWLDEGDR